MMSRAIVRMWAVCGVVVVVMAAGWTAVQACDPSTKVEFDPPVDSSLWGPLLHSVHKPPESCDDFDPADLMKCKSEVGFKEGCCDESCKEVLSGINEACLADFARAVCNEGGREGKESIKILNSLLHRCDYEQAELNCPADPAEKPSDEDIVKCLDPGTKLTDSQEAHKASKRVKIDSRLDVRHVAILFEVQIPATCDNFYSGQFLECLKDLDYKKGCCDLDCLKMFTKINATCLADIAQDTCNKWKKEGKKSIEILDNLARRCDDDYVPFSCSALGA